MRKIPLIAVGLSAYSITLLSQGDPLTGKVTRADDGLEVIGATHSDREKRIVKISEISPKF